MKITCTKCGKRFDGEEHMYICPKCNHYHSQVRADSRSRETISASNLFDKKTSKLKDKLPDVNVMDVMEDIVSGNNTTDDAPEFIKTVNGDQTVYTAVSKDKKNDEDFIDFSGPGTFLKKLGVALCVIIGFIMFISSSLSEYDIWSDNDDSWDSGWSSSYTDDVEVGYGEPMDFETFTVNVVEVGEPEIDGLKADDGYKLVQIDFKTDSSYEYESWDISTDVALELSNGEQWDYPQDVYYARYEDEVASERLVEEELYETGLVVEAHYSGEYFWIFEIPEDIVDVELTITSYVSDDEDDWSYTQDECIRMPLEL